MLIGIDGGGSKTALCLSDGEGRVLSRYTGEGTNPADIGLEKCEARLRAQLDALFSGAGANNAPSAGGAGVRSLYAGIAGSANELTSQAVRGILKRLLPECARVDNGSDAFNALYGEVGNGEGIALIAGTGSSAFALTAKGVYQVGGWGYLIDDAGSGFRLGADALKAVYRALDGRGAKTALSALIEAELGLPLAEAIPKIYEGGKKYIASLAPLVLQAAQSGDKLAQRLADDAARALALHIRTCAAHLSRFPAMCVISGGLIKDARFLMAIQLMLREDAERKYILRVPDVPPVYGALMRAALNAGKVDAAAFRSNFTATY